MTEDLESRLTRQVAGRAIRRLGILEVMLLGGAMALALVAGALVAFVLDASLGWPFRPTWAAASLLLFILPGALTLRRHRTNGGRRAST
ncbi:MAG TPA: hypothetical protein VGA70_02465 [Longimicrobiales bacterium]|jgi:uncharacterized membrane protein